ncbi:MAG: ABC transporter permease [Candidatus Aminicenantes bacterium]
MINKLQEIYKFKNLVYNLVARDLKVKYKGSILGFFWSLLNPLVMLIVYTIAFKYIIKIRVENFPIFFLCAFLPWTFLSLSLSMSVSSIKDNANLVKKVYFPREILPLSIVLSNLVQFLLTFLILIPALLIFKVKLGLPLVLLPLLIVFQLAFTLGLAYILSALNVFFSDIRHLLEIFLQIWFWLTPIIYPVSFVPERFQSLYRLNPMVSFVEAYRDSLLYNRWPSQYELLALFVAGVVFFIIGHAVFKSYNRRLAEEI